MGILESVVGGLMGGQQASSPIQSILGSLLGGASGQGQAGLGGLIQKFEQAGQGDVAHSWVNNGPNQSIDPNTLQNVFGQNQVSQWSQQTGMAPGALLGQLAHFLPHAVDGMTPNGQVPSDNAGGGGGGDNPFGGAGVDPDGNQNA